ncbi:MAG: HlyD family efflux transporter periplasmic adaptor subunit [Sulfurospirillaceae bacterium]|nr:HlyD family efflux transporter periplasmic adaptor subunit [Sulfurospirillaceae bacterium]
MVKQLFSGAFLLMIVSFLSGFSLFTPSAITFSGQIETHDAYLGSKVGGRVERIFKQEGESVQKGDAILCFDTHETNANIEALRAKIESQQQTLNKLTYGYQKEEILMAKAAMDAKNAIRINAQTQYQRQSKLFYANATTQQEFDTARNTLHEAEANYANSVAKLALYQNGFRVEDIAIQKALLKESQAELKLWLITLDEATIVAPENGRIEKISVQKGDLIGKNQIAVQFSTPQNMYAKFYVPETLLHTIHLGQKVTLHIDGSDKLFNAEIFYIANSAEFTPKNISTQNDRANLLFAVKAKISDPALKSGMFIEVIAP